jgi:hypothetical protein
MLGRWWSGRFVHHSNDARSPLYTAGGSYRRHWTAEWARAALRYAKAHHWRIIMAVLALAGIVWAI